LAQSRTGADSAAEATRRERPKWLVPMHMATITTQALDAHSTYSALHHNNVVEANPLMKGMAEHATALVAVKAGVAAAIVYSTEKLARRHRFAAFATALAVNSAYAMLVARNYSIAERARPITVPR
jgi:hypothetical protein